MKVLIDNDHILSEKLFENLSDVLKMKNREVEVPGFAEERFHENVDILMAIKKSIDSRILLDRLKKFDTKIFHD